MAPFPCIPLLRPEQASTLSDRKFLLPQSIIRVESKDLLHVEVSVLKFKITCCFVSERTHFHTRSGSERLAKRAVPSCCKEQTDAFEQQVLILNVEVSYPESIPSEGNLAAELGVHMQGK